MASSARSPSHSPKIEKIEVAARGDVRRAKLYYLRGRIGKRARVRERRSIGPEEVFDRELLHTQVVEEEIAPEEAVLATEGAPADDAAAEAAPAAEETAETAAAPEAEASSETTGDAADGSDEPKAKADSE